jgi:hypothetical protein
MQEATTSSARDPFDGMFFFRASDYSRNIDILRQKTFRVISVSLRFLRFIEECVLRTLQFPSSRNYSRCFIVRKNFLLKIEVLTVSWMMPEPPMNVERTLRTNYAASNAIIKIHFAKS